MSEPSQPDGHPEQPESIDSFCSKMWDSAYFHAGYQPYQPTPGKKNRKRNEILDLRQEVNSLRSHSVWMEETLRKGLKALTQLQEDLRSLRPGPSAGRTPKPQPIGILETEIQDTGNFRK